MRTGDYNHSLSCVNAAKALLVLNCVLCRAACLSIAEIEHTVVAVDVSPLEHWGELCL